MKNRKKNRIDGYRLGIMTALFLFLFVGPLITFKPAYDYTIVKNIMGYLFCLVLSAIFILQKKTFEFDMKNLVFFTTFALWSLFSSLTAPFGAGAAKEMENYILYFLIFLFAMNITLKKNDVYIWLSSGTIASLIALFNFLGPRRYVVSTFGNPNFFAGHMVMLVALAVSMLFMKIDRKERYLLISFFVISSVSVLATRSRAAISASVFGIATVMFLVYDRGAFIKKWGGYIVFFLAGILAYPHLYHWVMTDIRFYIWRGTLNLIGEKPLTGWGLGNFVFFYPYYRIREYFLQDVATPVTTQVHNEYLHLFSEIGVIGLLLFIGVIAIVIVNVFKETSRNDKLKGRGKTAGQQWENIFIKGCIAGIVAVLLDNIFSTNLRNPSTAMYFWFLLGLCAGYIRKKETVFKFSMVFWYAAGITAFTMCVFTSFYRIMPQVYLKRGIWAREVGKLKEAIDNYQVVCSVNPHNYEAFYKMAFAYGQSGHLKEAKEIYITINKYIFPHFAKTDANLGTVYLREGDVQRALYYYRWAEWFNPYDVDVLCGEASVYITFYGDIPKAVAYLKRVLTIDPKNGYANRVMELLKKQGKI